MWILEPTTQPENKTHSILGDHKYVVGRQNCDIVVADPSVSRRQAVLTMAHYETNVAKSFIIPTLTLEDVSKFGTYVNGKAVKTAGGNTVTLKENDQIKFGGTPASVYRAKYQPFLATTSCLEKGPKKALQRVMCLLGGHLVRDWRPACDLLIMSKINVTLKVICAINNQKHIVTPNYLDDLHQHLMGRSERPDPSHYLPEVVDQEVPPGVSFHPDKRRQTLLKGLKFYFLSPLQFNKTNLAVSTAGGQPILLEDGCDEDAEAMTQSGTVVVLVTKDVMDTLSPASAKFVRTVMATLKKKNLRMITDPEIGTAILTCNMVDYCNPRAALAPNLQAAMASQILSQMTDIDNSQVNVPPVTLKPEIRSSPGQPITGVRNVPGHSSLVQQTIRSAPAQPSPGGPDTAGKSSLDQQTIKPERISQSSSNSSEATGKAPGKSAASQPEGLQTSDVARPHTAVSATGLTKASSEADSGDHSASSARAFKVPSRIGVGSMSKESDGAKSNRVMFSQLSGDLFSDVGAADESPPRPGVPGVRDEERETHPHIHENKTDGLSVFARQRNKKRGSFVVAEVDDEDSSRASERPIKQHRMSSLFDDDDENNVDGYGSKNNERKRRGTSKRKNLFDDDSEEETSSGLLHKRLCKSGENDSLRSKCGDDVNRLRETDPEFQEAHQDISLEPAPGMDNKTGVTDLSCGEEDNDDYSSLRNSKTGTGGHSHLKVSEKNQTLHTEASTSPARAGWVNVTACKTRARSEVEGESGENVEDTDVKPDVELLRDESGQVLRNLCRVEFKDLMTRQPGTKTSANQCRDSIKTAGLKDFKKFIKTKHAGADKLPTIIGGRDLEEHRGTIHKDLEDLFTKGIARQNEREEEERQNRDLFDWDTKSKKAPNRRFL